MRSKEALSIWSANLHRSVLAVHLLGPTDMLNRSRGVSWVRHGISTSEWRRRTGSCVKGTSHACFLRWNEEKQLVVFSSKGSEAQLMDGRDSGTDAKWRDELWWRLSSSCVLYTLQWVASCRWPRRPPLYQGRHLVGPPTSPARRARDSHHHLPHVWLRWLQHRFFLLPSAITCPCRLAASSCCCPPSNPRRPSAPSSLTSVRQPKTLI
jgi:hypothetical protein